MDFRKLSGSLLVATTVFAGSLPAEANPFQIRPNLFETVPSVTAPGAVGNAGSAIAPNATAQPNRPAAPQNPVGNSEIQGLGDNQSWIDPNVLANDPRAMCSDIGLGNNTRSSSTRVALNTSSSERTAQSRSHNDQGGGGVSIFGIGVSGNGGSQGSQNQSASRDSRTERNDSSSLSTSTVVVGRNCDAFVDAAAQRDMNYQDNLTDRYRIRVERRGQQVDTLMTDR